MCEHKKKIYYIVVVQDSDLAWKQIMSVKYYGPGNSRTNSLYWVASRPLSHGYGNSSSAAMNAMNTSQHMTRLSDMCAENSACDALGMTGKCCPTENNVRLGCCPVIVPPGQ